MRILTLVFLLFFSHTLLAQRANALLDKSNIKIGEPITLELKSIYNKDLKCITPFISDSLNNGFVLINKLSIDSTFNNSTNEIQLIKRYQITNFDTGSQTLAPFKFNFIKGKDTVESVLSDPLTVRINLVAVDTTKDIKEIKDIIEVPFSLSEYLPWIGIGAGIVAIIALVIYFYLKRKKPVAKPEPVQLISPLEEALKNLEKLENEKLWQQGYLKNYYSRLTEILRVYLEKEFNIPALEQVTDEIFVSMKNYGFSTEATLLVKQALETADLVKFAKSTPSAEQHERAFQIIKQFISQHQLRNTTENKEEK